MDLKMNLERGWFWNGLAMDLEWTWNGLGMDLEGPQDGFGMDLQWTWNRVVMTSELLRNNGLAMDLE